MKVRYVVETYGGNPREVYRADTESRCLEWIEGQMNESERQYIALAENCRTPISRAIVQKEFTIRTVYTNEE